MIELELPQVAIESGTGESGTGEPRAVAGAVPVDDDDAAFSAWYRSEHPRLLAG
jgi:hypothetical protein